MKPTLPILAAVMAAAPDRHPPCPGPASEGAAGHRHEGRAAVRRQGRRAPGQRRRPGARVEDPRRRDRPLHPRRRRGHRPGRRDALARLHRRAHPPDGRVNRRLEAAVRRRLPPRAGREGDRIHRARAEGAGGRVHHGARRGQQRPARRRPAQRDRPRAGPGPPDAGRGPRAGGPRRPRRRDRAPPRPRSRSSGRPRGSLTGRTGSARRSASRSSTAPT